MRWQDMKRSTRVDDRRGQGGFGMGGLRGGLPIGGGFGIIAVLVIAALLGINPLALLGGGDARPPSEGTPPANHTGRDFVSDILGSTEETWGKLFQESGQNYPQPSLVLFSGMTQSGCGTGQSAMGPFYCPLDQTVYIDLSFYDDLRQKLGA